MSSEAQGVRVYWVVVLHYFPNRCASCQEIIYLLLEHNQRIKRLLTIFVHSLCLLTTYVCVVDGHACMSHTEMKGLVEGHVSFTEHEQRFGKTCTAWEKKYQFL